MVSPGVLLDSIQSVDFDDFGDGLAGFEFQGVDTKVDRVDAVVD